MWKTDPIKPDVKKNEEKVSGTKSEGFDDILQVHTSPGGTQYVDVLDIFLNDRIFDEMERLSQAVGIQKKDKI